MTRLLSNIGYEPEQRFDMENQELNNETLSLSRGSLSGKRNSMGSIPIPSSTYSKSNLEFFFVQSLFQNMSY